jgi:hypothetical protein
MENSINNSNSRNFGVSTEFSKNLNEFFGDETGRSVSMRTAHGFKLAFNFHEMNDETAEDIVHVAMVAVPPLLKSKSDELNVVGILLILGLVGCYINGR